MPSLNVEKYIDDCMKSVISQDLSDIEIICVDAYSSDGTYEKIIDYQKKDNRIKIIQSRVKSYGYQVNLGIAAANGKYISIVETDDVLRNGMFSTLYNLAEENNLDYVKCEFAYMRSGIEEYECEDCLEKDIKYNCILNPSQSPLLFINDCNIWRGIYRKTFLVENNIQLHESKGAAYQDIGFLMQVLTKATKAMYINDYFYCYRIDRDEASSYKDDIFKYVSQEFRWLFEEKRVDRSKGLYLRLMQASLHECDKLLAKHGFDDSIGCVRNFYGWVQKTIDEGLVSGQISCQDMNSYQWFLVNMFVYDFETYTKIKQMEYTIERKKEKDFFTFSEGHPIYIFGCGQYGMKLLRLAKAIDVEVCGFVDNNSLLWGEKRKGVVINSPEVLRKSNPKCRVVIANKFHWKEIMEQLAEIGVNEVFIWK